MGPQTSFLSFTQANLPALRGKIAQLSDQFAASPSTASLALGADDLSSLDAFEELPTLFKPIMHMLLLVWKHSKYYNTPPCLAVIMCEICNDLVEQARRFVVRFGMQSVPTEG